LPWEAVFFIFEALDFAHRNRIRRWDAVCSAILGSVRHLS
jgi:hypothetical protein